LARQAQELGERLRDPRQTVFHWVLLPEELSIAESEDALAALDRSRIGVAEVIVNRVTPDGPPCPVCDARRAAERRLIAQLSRRLGRTPIRFVEATAREPRGLAALARLGRRLIGSGAAPAKARPAAQQLRRAFAPHRSRGVSRTPSITPLETIPA